MASGLQCPGCGHVHPAGLPEIARGDATFRCYGCYRTLSVPEGWAARSAPRPPAPDPGARGDAPPGAGTRDARSARLAGRRGFWPSSSPAGESAPAGDDATQLVPLARASTTTVDPGLSGPGPSGPRLSGSGLSGRGTRAASAAPAGWVAPRRSGRPVPTAVRGVVWAVAFAVGFLVTAVVLRQFGLLGVNTVLDLYAGSGLRRFGVLLVMLPLWAVLSATAAHFSLEFLAARRRRRPAPADTSTPA